MAKPYLELQNFGDLITADRKVLSDNYEFRNNHWYAVVVQDLTTQWIQAYPCKTKTSQETQRSLQQFLEPDRNPRIIYTDNSLEFGKVGEDLLESLHVYTTQIRDKWDCWESSAQSKGRHLCWIVAIRSEWKLVGRWYGMWHLSAKRHRFIIWWEDALWKTFSATIQRADYSIWFIGWVSPYDCEGPVKNPSIWKESLTWIVLRIRIVRGRIRKAGCRPWGVGDDGRIGNLLEKTQCERGDILQTKKIYFSNRRWTNQTPWRRSRFENIHLDTAATNSRRKSPEAINDSGPCQETSCTAITLNPESCFTRREKNHACPIPLKYIDVSRTAHRNLDVLQERRIDDYWNIDGSRDLSDCWTGFTILLEEEPPNGYMCSGKRLTRKQLTSRPDHLWPELWIKWERMPSWRRSKCGRMKSFIDQEDKETIKNARKNLETPMAPALPCKTSKKSKHVETRGKTNEIKSKFACILEASESTRMRMGETLPNHHEDHIAGRSKLWKIPAA